MIFTRDELAGAAGALPLTLVGDHSVYEYEKAHLPDGAWPPTSWYAAWVSGLDVFDVEREASPVEIAGSSIKRPAPASGSRCRRSQSLGASGTQLIELSDFGIQVLA